jgi:hypothetical protein
MLCCELEWVDDFWCSVNCDTPWWDLARKHVCYCDVANIFQILPYTIENVSLPWFPRGRRGTPNTPRKVGPPSPQTKSGTIASHTVLVEGVLLYGVQTLVGQRELENPASIVPSSYMSQVKTVALDCWPGERNSMK